MKIAYYMPFKAMGHPNPSGDLIIGTEIFEHLRASGNSIKLASTLRMRWIYYNPFKLLQLLFEQRRAARLMKRSHPNLWLSYHSYYKAPDLMGPYCSSRLQIPYVIFQGIYSTKRRKKLSTLPGFLLNRRALLKATHIFTNKRRDHQNLLRIVPAEKLTYIAPGIHPAHFYYSPKDREAMRKKWQTNNAVVIITAAMMRKGVKTNGISTVIDTCGKLLEKGLNIKLIIAGDGECRSQLEKQAAQQLHDNYDFVGKIQRNQLYKYYSSADIFAFPGVEESLGMVYLEAQSCRLPAVAYEDWGAKEAIQHQVTGLLSPAVTPKAFTENLQRLIEDPELRKKIGLHGEKHIRTSHDLSKNYALLNDKLKELSKNIL